ncbi:MAG: DUF1501 domain-containing protein [Gemmataceae bacterium]|nr:DUF1501 domain-containing protein [Gemmataceae bacterium]
MFTEPIGRRAMLARCANGFGSLALAGLLADSTRAAPHFAAKARSVIFLYMDGGPSQIDTFSYKPALEKYNGRNPRELLKVEPTQFDKVGNMLASPWKFSQRGRAGHWVSDLLPHLAECADDLAFIHSMTSKFSEHTSANYFLHSGSGLQGRPSVGSWCLYGLGSANSNLPGFVVLNGGLIPPGGLETFGAGFLPAAYQASVFKPGDHPVANIRPAEPAAKQSAKRDLVKQLDAAGLARHGSHDAIEAAIANAETAFRMQTAVPELADLRGESEATKKMYGLDSTYDPTRIYARECLLARRLVERGVRFVELTCPNVGHDRWDQHDSLRQGHEKNCRAVDQPIAALIKDLKARGLWESTLVVWAGEFGRTPFAQGVDGRDHNPFGFTVWLGGGGVKPGISHGETDEWGYKTVAGRVEMHDFHATLLHLLGFDHKRLTVRFGGRDMRLTDVHGEVVREVLA